MVGKIDIGWWLSFNDLYPSLNNAVTWRQKRPSTSGHFAYQVQQLWFLKDLRALRTKFTVTFRWNLKEGVLELETVKMCWNGFANAFPVDTKYWFMVWRQRDFLVCHFPFLKIEKKKKKQSIFYHQEVLVLLLATFYRKHLWRLQPSNKIISILDSFPCY